MSLSLSTSNDTKVSARPQFLACHRQPVKAKNTDQQTIDAAASASSGKCSNKCWTATAAVASGLAAVAFALLAGLCLWSTIAAGMSGVGAPLVVVGVAATLFLLSGAAVCGGLSCYNFVRLF